MNTYKHWLKINGYKSDENKQISEIETYLQKYPNSKVTIYHYKYDFFDKVVLLECEQDYNDLDMQVNSGFNNLRRLSGEPIYIVERKDLEISGGEIRRKMREEVKEDWEIDN